MNRHHRADARLWRRWLAALPLGGGLGACSPDMNALAGASEMSSRVANLSILMIAMGAAIVIGVMVLMVMAWRRGRARDPARPDLSRPGPRFVVVGGVIVPSAVLITLFIVGAVLLGAAPLASVDAPTFKVTAQQWWWRIDYLDPDPARRFTTANELHIPVGQRVRLEMSSADVIHSLWIPELHGKLDLIPGDTNVLTLHASRPGRYGGECAEYCGVQHAHMRFVVVAEEPEAFARWLDEQRTAAAPPADSTLARGQRLFVTGPCALCHTVRGTEALGSVGPDLTHVGSRLTIAAGTLPNTLGNMEAWIVNAQAIKPGVAMPPVTQYTGPQIRALAAYLMSLR